MRLAFRLHDPGHFVLKVLNDLILVKMIDHFRVPFVLKHWRFLTGPAGPASKSQAASQSE
jgi:hypothetical protein